MAKKTTQAHDGQASALEMVAPDRLRRNPRNPRVNAHAVEAVARSIERFGFAAPIVARPSDGMILAGDTRYQAAAILGLAEMPVRWLELDDQAALAYAIADNRLNEIAGYDVARLEAIMADLPDDLRALTGFTDDEVRQLVATAEATAAAAEPAVWGGGVLGTKPSVLADLVVHGSAADLARLHAYLEERMLRHGEGSAAALARLLPSAEPTE